MFLHSGASAQSSCFVLLSFGSSGYQLGTTMAAVSAQRPVEHVKNALQNIMTERMPQSVQECATCQVIDSLSNFSVDNSVALKTIMKRPAAHAALSVLWFVLRLDGKRRSTTYSAIHPVIRKVLKMRIWGVPRLVGRYCSYLLPKQALATHIINTKNMANNCCTGWGGHLFRRFCNMFSESSLCLLGQHGSCSTAQQPGNSQKTFYKTFGTSGRPT